MCPVPASGGTWHSAQASGSSPGAPVYPAGGPAENAPTGCVPLLLDSANPSIAANNAGNKINLAFSNAAVLVMALMTQILLEKTVCVFQKIAWRQFARLFSNFPN
jgi:hypothetical protein